MDRRTFIGTFSGGLLAAPLAAEAQSAGKVYRIGVLSPGAAPPGPLEALRQGLRELGYDEGPEYRDRMAIRGRTGGTIPVGQVSQEGLGQGRDRR